MRAHAHLAVHHSPHPPSPPRSKSEFDFDSDLSRRSEAKADFDRDCEFDCETETDSRLALNADAGYVSMHWRIAMNTPLSLIAGFVFFASAAARADIGSDLLAAYFFNGTADDASGRGHHAQLVGAEFATDRHGRPDSALRLDGKGAYAATPVSGDRIPVSFSFWFRLEDRPGLRPYSIVDSGIGESFGHAFVIGSGTETFNANLAANFPFARGRWTHVAVSYGKQLRVFMDGRLVAERPYTPATNFAAGNFQIGRHAGSEEARYFPGVIDDVLIFGRELGEDDARRLFEEVPAIEQNILLASAPGQPVPDATPPAPASAALLDPRPIFAAASSVEDDAHDAWRAFDGDEETFWSGAPGETAWWIAAEFHPALTLAELEILHADHSITNALPYFSLDADTWSDLAPALEEGPVTARFLMLGFTPDDTGESPRIREIRWKSPRE
jgi:hypothetical protein